MSGLFVVTFTLPTIFLIQSGLFCSGTSYLYLSSATDFCLESFCFCKVLGNLVMQVFGLPWEFCGEIETYTFLERVPPRKSKNQRLRFRPWEGGHVGFRKLLLLKVYFFNFLYQYKKTASTKYNLTSNPARTKMSFAA